MKTKGSARHTGPQGRRRGQFPRPFRKQRWRRNTKVDRVGNGFGKAMVRLWHHTATAKDSQPIRREPLKKGANIGLWRLQRGRHRCDAKVMGRGAYLYGRKGFAVMVRNVRVIGRRPTKPYRVRLKVVYSVKTGMAWDRDAVFAWFCEAKTP